MHIFKRLLFLFVLLFSCFTIGLAQSKETNRATLSPEQQKALEYARNLNLINNNAYSETEEEGFLPKKREEKRIQAVRNIPLNKSDMLSFVNRVFLASNKLVDQALLEKCAAFTKGRKAEEISTTAVLLWYQGSEEEAILISLEAVRLSPDSAYSWNNFGALLNLCNMEELAIPVLNYGLWLKPGNANLLNNLGQAYLGLGVMDKAEDYLKQCLAIAPSHPEATRSMGVVEASKGNTAAEAYLQKDVATNMRESSYNILKKINPTGFSLNALRKRFLSSKAQNQKDFFSLLAFQNLDLPKLPYNTGETEKWRQEAELYIQSVTAELEYWLGLSGAATDKDNAVHQNLPYYSWLVEGVINELNEIYATELLPASDIFINELSARNMGFELRLQGVNCPDAPEGASIQILKAYDVKCEHMKKAIHDAYMSNNNEKVRRNYELRNGNWKTFLNDLISTIELCPTPDNINLLYTYLWKYTAFLSGTVQMVAAIDDPLGDNMSLIEAEMILKQSKRNLNLKCPEFLQFDYAIPGVGAINFGCTYYKLEVTPFKMTKLGYKKSFKDQTSTISLGVGPSWTIGHVGVSAGVEAFLVFDKHDQFINSGISAEAKAALPQGIAELSATTKVELNSGYSHEVKTDSRWVNGVKVNLAGYK